MIPPPTDQPNPSDVPLIGFNGIGDYTPSGYGQSHPNGKKTVPPAPDFSAANAAQTKANRPDQTNAFGTSTHWNPDGSQTSSFGGGLGAAAGNLENQLAASTASPMDFGSLPELQYGQDAFNRASDAAYKQETSRLDPMWGQREEAERARLANQGLDPGSEAFQHAMDDFGRGRNDAYQGAINSSIGLGQSAANQMFNQSSAARTQRLAEMLLGKKLPLEMLQGLGGFTGQAGFAQDQGLTATGMQAAQDLARYQQQQQQDSDLGGGIGGILGLLGKIAGLK